jgi:hypothetical protein
MWFISPGKRPALKPADPEKLQKTWSYKNYEIEEGLKPGSSQFRYFFVVSESGEKKCNFCVWIADEAMSRFDPSKDFNSIVSSHIETCTSGSRKKSMPQILAIEH